MKNINKLLMLLFVSLTMTACLVDDEVPYEGYDQSPTFVGFEGPAATASISSTGEVVEYLVKIRASGPSYQDMTEPVTVNVSIDEAASTAVEGVNYLPLENSTITLTAENNYMATLPVQIETAGITPPLEVSPTLVINIDDVSGGSDVVVNGISESVTVTINYLCFSDLSGVYVINYASGPVEHVVTELSAGQYEMSFFPGFPGDTVGAFTFSDVCGQLTMLSWGYSNVITGIGHVDEATGDIIWDSVTVEGVAGYDNLSWTMVKQP